MTSLGFIKKFRLFHMLCIAHVQYKEAIGQTRFIRKSKAWQHTVFAS
jgi:hypothetical protein